MNYKWESTTLPKARDKFMEYFNDSTGPDPVKYEKACIKFEDNHKLGVPYKNFYSFKQIYNRYKDD